VNPISPTLRDSIYELQSHIGIVRRMPVSLSRGLRPLERRQIQSPEGLEDSPFTTFLRHPVKSNFVRKMDEYFGQVSKGQLILKCPFGVFKSPKKSTKFFLP